MDRRSFLRSSAVAALVTASREDRLTVAQSPPSEHPMAPPVVAQSAATQSLEPFTWQAGGLLFRFEFSGTKLRLRSVLPEGVAEPAGVPAMASDLSGLETSLHCTGEDVPDHHGAKLSGGVPGKRMTFAGRLEEDFGRNRQMMLTQEDAALGLRVQSVYERFLERDGTGELPVVRRSTRVTNLGTREVGIEYLSSAMLNHFANPATFAKDLRIHFAYNSWQAEAQWRTMLPAELGLVENGNFTVSGALFSTIGSWPCETYLPMLMVENTRLGVTWFWQVEHNGSWHCEIAQTAERALYAYMGGPDAVHAQAWKSLQPGEVYETVPVAMGCVRGGFEEAVRELTRYRRATLRHPRADGRECPVIFNDVVMLDGDQTTAREQPLIEAAAAAGCEVFCMDVGWSARPGEGWWDAVGDWQPNRERFPGGIGEVTRRIRERGMVPGIWIEPEVAGMGSALARQPDSWFFVRHGRRVIDHSRYQLDFRNPEVVRYTDGVFDRLIGEYGFEYIKLDYNINALEGTELRAESFGQGLLGHNRAFLAWLDALLDRYPRLTLETVASGGMRMESSMLSRAQLQSISDADDYRVYSSLTTGSSAALLPEQMGVWSQPMRDSGPEATSCNMVNAMQGRIHQSGFLPVLRPESAAQVRAGIAVYKGEIRRHLPRAVPFYPLGMADMTRPGTAAALGMRSPEAAFVAVWRRDGPAEVRVPCRAGEGARLLYPTDLGVTMLRVEDGLVVTFPQVQMGCVVRL